MVAHARLKACGREARPKVFFASFFFRKKKNPFLFYFKAA